MGETEVITYSYNIADSNGGNVAQTATITITGSNDDPTVGAAITSTASTIGIGSMQAGRLRSQRRGQLSRRLSSSSMISTKASRGCAPVRIRPLTTKPGVPRMPNEPASLASAATCAL